MDRILIDDIMNDLRNAIYDGIGECPELFPIFNHASSLMLYLNDYSLKYFDDTLYDNVVLEVVNYLKS